MVACESSAAMEASSSSTPPILLRAIEVEGSPSEERKVKDPRKIARKYQLELAKRAVEENIIVYLGTGCGKTHIAVLLMYELGHLIRKPAKNVCVFLAPTVPLVRQDWRTQAMQHSVSMSVVDFLEAMEPCKTQSR